MSRERGSIVISATSITRGVIYKTIERRKLKREREKKRAKRLCFNRLSMAHQSRIQARDQFFTRRADSTAGARCRCISAASGCAVRGSYGGTTSKPRDAASLRDQAASPASSRPSIHFTAEKARGLTPRIYISILLLCILTGQLVHAFN